MPPEGHIDHDSIFEFIKSEWKGVEVYHRNDRLIVKVIPRDDSDSSIVDKLEEVIRDITGATIIRRIRKWAIVGVPPAPATDIVHEAEILDARADIEYAEPDLAVYPAEFPGGEPEDPCYNNRDGLCEKDQWGLKQISAVEAWALEMGSDKVLIGIVDSGIIMNAAAVAGGSTDPRACIDNPDLADNDGSRAGRFVLGHDYTSGGGVPQDRHAYSHGTRMTGIIAAVTNNNTGMAGLNWTSPVYVTKVFDTDNQGSQGDVVSAVEEIVAYAVGQNSISNVVINLSLGFQNDEPEVGPDGIIGKSLKDMCGDLVGKPVILCCSAGNNEKPVEAPARYSANYPDHVIAVGGTQYQNPTESMWTSSNFGPEVTVVAPAKEIVSLDLNEKYTWASGTSEAAAHATGAVSLVWSHNLGLTPGQVIECIKKTAWVPEGTVVRNDFWGYGRIDLFKALKGVEWEVELLTPSVYLMNVPDLETRSERIKFAVRSCATVSFRVDVQGYDFGISNGVYYHEGTNDPEVETLFELTASYTATQGNPAAAGTVRVTWRETGQSWNVYLTGSRRPTQNMLAVLVLDKSGSMSRASGVGSYTRMQVVHFSANTLVDLIDPGNAAGLVSFNHEAHEVVPLGIIDPNDPADLKGRLATGIDGLAAGGWTSIGAGVNKAQNILAAFMDPRLTGDETRAIMVLTDGKENWPPFITDVINDISAPVFAIGVGTPDVLEPAGLLALTSATGGYTVVTGNLDAESEFKVAKYFAQMLARLDGGEVFLDPTGRIKPGQDHEIAFKITTEDIRFDVILMTPVGGLMKIKLIPPDCEGDEITPIVAKTSEGMSYLTTQRVTRYRIDLPATIGGDKEVHAGTWRAVLSVNPGAYKDYMVQIENDGGDPSIVENHGALYSLMVGGRSNVKMVCNVSQNGHEPGTDLILRANVTERGLPPSDTVSVFTDVYGPDYVVSKKKLERIAPSIYGAVIPANVPGVYECKITAEGRTHGSERFTREQVVTGAVWHGTGGPL